MDVNKPNYKLIDETWLDGTILIIENIIEHLDEYPEEVRDSIMENNRYAYKILMDIKMNRLKDPSALLANAFVEEVLAMAADRDCE